MDSKERESELTQEAIDECMKDIAIIPDQKIPYKEAISLNIQYGPKGDIFDVFKMESYRKVFGYAPMNHKSVMTLTGFIGEGNALEVCGGLGFISYLLASNGIDIVCTDKMVSHHQSWQSTWYPVIKMDAVEAVQTYRRDCLICSWAPLYSTFLWDCIKEFKGDKMIIIGENQGGCTGNPGYDELSLDWRVQVKKHPDFKVLNSKIFLCTRKFVYKF